MEHLSLLCSWTNSVWTDPEVNIQVSHQNLTRIEVWFQDQILQPGNPLTFDAVAAILWFIRKARNDFVFRRKPPNSRTLIDSARKFQQVEQSKFETLHRNDSIDKELDPTEDPYFQNQYR